MSDNRIRAEGSMVITTKPNQPDAPNAAIALGFHSGRQSRGVGDPGRWLKKACRGPVVGYHSAIVQLADVQKQAAALTPEERQSLLAFLLHDLRGLPEGPDDEELMRRDAEMDSGEVVPLSHEEFLSQVGRER